MSDLTTLVIGSCVAGAVCVVLWRLLASRKRQPVASNPGQLTLDETLLEQLHPELFSESARAERLEQLGWESDSEVGDRRVWIETFADHLREGDCHAAIVIETDPVVVSAYADELDCIVILMFDIDGLAKRHRLEAGTRLLGVNMYYRGVRAPDLVPGPDSRGVYANFAPLIADFLTADRSALHARKLSITKREWSRLERMTSEYLAKFGFRGRDGRPMYCDRALVRE